MFSVKAVSDFKQVSKKALIFCFFYVCEKENLYVYLGFDFNANGIKCYVCLTLCPSSFSFHEINADC